MGRRVRQSARREDHTGRRGDGPDAGQLAVAGQWGLAPERALGKDASPASDTYALGCVLYELLVGHPPFRADTPTALLYQHVQESPLPPHSVRAELTAELEKLVLALLAKEPENRPDAERVADRLSAPERWGAIPSAGLTSRLP
ncbi:protein kinase domain-containing protein [Streptomyces sp. NPDC004721]